MKNELKASELVLAPDGSLYHIRLKPHQIADNVILVGDPKRVEMVSKNFDRILFKTSNREINAHTGELNGKGITVISTGMGTDNIDIVVTELDACVNINLETREFNSKQRKLNLIRLGTSGSLQEEIPCGSFLCSKYVIGIDGMMYFYKNIEGIINKAMTQDFISFMQWDNTLPMPYAVGVSEALLSYIAYDMIEGITITAPGFYAPQGRELRLPPAFPNINKRLSEYEYMGYKATNYEMETSALYALGKNLGHNVLTICLIIANRDRGEFLENYNSQMEELVKLVLKRLCS